MEQNLKMKGEKIYEYDFDLIAIVINYLLDQKGRDVGARNPLIIKVHLSAAGITKIV